MIKSAPFTTEVPYLNEISDKATGLVARAWTEFFRSIRDSIDSLGYEKSFILENDISSPENVEGLSFNYKKVSCAFVDYYIQRVTTSTGATELIESGTFKMQYLPASEDWELNDGPTTAGITLTSTPEGAVQYESSDITGTPSISKITWRARTLASKNSLYSEVGR